MDDPILIAKLASKIQIQRDDEAHLLCHSDAYIGSLVGIAAPERPPCSESQASFKSYFNNRLHWTIKAEAALRVMLAKEILNAAAK